MFVIQLMHSDEIPNQSLPPKDRGIVSFACWSILLRHVIFNRLDLLS